MAQADLAGNAVGGGEVALERRDVLVGGRSVAAQRLPKPDDPRQTRPAGDDRVDLLEVEQPATGELGDQPAQLFVALVAGGLDARPGR